MPEIVSELVEVFIYRKVEDEFEFLLLKRSKDEAFPDIWSVAGGKVRKNEKASDAAIREMHEETGLKAKHFYLVDAVNTFYEISLDVIHIVPVFLSEAEEVDVNLSEEHSEYKWMKYDEAYEKIFWNGWKNNIKLINNILRNENLFKTLQEINI